MSIIFYYSSIIAIMFLFMLIAIFKKLKLASVVIGIASVGYSLISDVTFGDQLKLFHYFTPQVSTLFMIFSAILIYSPLNMIYTRFLPSKNIHAILYTLCWISALLIFEYGSVMTKTVVFTGWKPLPWSIYLYIVSYLWIYFLYRFLDKKMQQLK